MKTLTLYSDNEENLRLIRELAEKLGVQTAECRPAECRPAECRPEESPEEIKQETVADVLNEWHQKGGMSTSIKDPVAWQKQQRKDRELPFRD